MSTPSPFDTATTAVLNAAYGSRVRYQQRDAGETGEATLELVWYGVCEVINLKRFDGTKLHLYPELGDTAQLA